MQRGRGKEKASLPGDGVDSGLLLVPDRRAPIFCEDCRPLPEDHVTPKLRVCTHIRPGLRGCCADGGGELLLAALRSEVERRGLRVTVEATCCLGHCAVGPNIKAAPDGPLLHHCQSAEDVLGRLPDNWPMIAISSE